MQISQIYLLVTWKVKYEQKASMISTHNTSVVQNM